MLTKASEQFSSLAKPQNKPLINKKPEVSAVGRGQQDSDEEEQDDEFPESEENASQTELAGNGSMRLITHMPPTDI